MSKIEYLLEVTYLAIAKNYWGLGPHEEAAKASCRKAGGRAPYAVYRLPPGCSDIRVSEIGDVSWVPHPESPTKEMVKVS